MLCRQKSRLDTLKKDLVVKGGPGRSTERDNQIHKIRKLCRPLVGLSSAHRPPDDSTQVIEAQMLRHEGVLGTDIIVEGAFGERAWGLLVRWR